MMLKGAVWSTWISRDINWNIREVHYDEMEEVTLTMEPGQLLQRISANNLIIPTFIMPAKQIQGKLLSKHGRNGPTD
jgi:hypothetical protein